MAVCNSPETFLMSRAVMCARPGAGRRANRGIFTVRLFLAAFLFAFLGYLVLIRARRRSSQSTFIRVTEPVTGLSIEGAELLMNLKNTEQVGIEVQPKNRKGGPAT